MNATVSTLGRQVEVQSKIRKVRAFSRGARVACSALFGFGLVGGVGLMILGIVGLVFPGPISNMSNLGDPSFTPEQKAWVLPMAAVVIAVWLASVHQLYRLFGSLAAGAIYTPENVRRIRSVGLLYLVLAVFTVLIPAAWNALYAYVFVNPSPAEPADWFSWSASLSAFITAGLILLVSWIMDVGLYEKDHADELRRDADLII